MSVTAELAMLELDFQPGGELGLCGFVFSILIFVAYDYSLSTILSKWLNRWFADGR